MRYRSTVHITEIQKKINKYTDIGLVVKAMSGLNQSNIVNTRKHMARTVEMWKQRFKIRLNRFMPHASVSQIKSKESYLNSIWIDYPSENQDQIHVLVLIIKA